MEREAAVGSNQELHERVSRRPYRKPELVVYGTVFQLTRSGRHGSQMDSNFMSNQLKTGF